MPVLGGIWQFGQEPQSCQTLQLIEDFCFRLFALSTRCGSTVFQNLNDIMTYTVG